MKYDVNRYKFFGSKRKLKQSSVSGGSSSSTGTVPVSVEKPLRRLLWLNLHVVMNRNWGKIAKLKGIDSIRLSESFADLTSQPGYQKALKSLGSASEPINLHGSLPCTPWSRWQYL